MSCQYPELQDIEYLTSWAEHKIIHIAQQDRTENFINVANLSRSIAFYLSTLETVQDSSQIWLKKRISETYYAMSDMRVHDQGSEKFNQAENLLTDTLKYIASYYEENGCNDPSLNVSTSISKVWRPPSEWLKKHPEELNN